jgi:hypothetical protein
MDEHRMKQQASALTFLTQYSEQGDDFLRRIVTGNETWVSHLNPWIEAAAHGMEAHIITNKEEIQTDHFNSQDHLHSVFGQKRHSACGILASRFSSQCRCLLRRS